jgi:hypothetical protein
LQYYFSDLPNLLLLAAQSRINSEQKKMYVSFYKKVRNEQKDFDRENVKGVSFRKTKNILNNKNHVRVVFFYKQILTVKLMLFLFKINRHIFTRIQLN